VATTVQFTLDNRDLTVLWTWKKSQSQYFDIFWPYVTHNTAVQFPQFTHLALQYCNTKVLFYFEQVYSSCGSGIFFTALHSLR